MAKKVYTPQRGDLIFINFDPQSGREQAGTRPAVVISGTDYNKANGRLAVVCAITNKQKGYPFEVVIPDGLPITGVVLADHMKSLDMVSRKAVKRGELDELTMKEIEEKVKLLLVL